VSYDPTTPAERTKQMRSLPDMVRKAAIAASINVHGHQRFLERARRVEVDMEIRRSGEPK
jgi:hypothetical protein